MRICLTGGIACGKSLFAGFLRKLGVEVLDADDVVHSIIPEDERRRLAATVFSDVAARRALEARIHPLVRTRLAEWHRTRAAGRRPGVEIVPLLFEVHWEGDYDTIAAIVSPPDLQIERMVRTRGYSAEEARARLAAQMPAEEKARLSDYVIHNDSTVESLEREARLFLAWLERREA